MKVPPPQNLIDSALPPQSIVRQFVLAAAAHAILLCGAASAQSAPAAPPLSLWNAVAVTHSTAPDQITTLESSTDLRNWQAVGDPVYGDASSLLQSVSANGAGGSGYFRLKVETQPALGFSRWSLTGTRILVTTETGPHYLTFAPGGTGSRSDGTTAAAFAWEWQRTGRDTGRASITWPDGVSETMSLEFTAANTGVFTSERTRGGVPSGAVSGTFRDEAAPGIAPTAPASPGDTSLVLASTGRPMCIDLSATGRAGISSPSGTRREFSVHWTSVGATKAVLYLTCTDGGTELCDLHFTGPACGTYVLRSEKGGLLRREARGSFTLAPR